MNSSDPELLVTVDYEERYHGIRSIEEKDYDNYDSRLERTTPVLLDLLDRTGTSATFFVLGQVADSSPDLVSQIESAGHEIASHAYSHRFMCDLTLEQFREEVRTSRNKLDEATSEDIVGFRAPYFSLTTDQIPEYFEVLKRENYDYDASLNSSSLSFFEDGNAPREPTEIETLTEYPLSTLSLMGYHLPVTGGFFFRFLPYSLTRIMVQNVLEHRDSPVVFYFHPWSLEDLDWRLLMDCSPREKITHFWGRSSFKNKLAKLLSEFQTTSLQKYLRERE